jgi:septin family protein
MDDNHTTNTLLGDPEEAPDSPALGAESRDRVGGLPPPSSRRTTGATDAIDPAAALRQSQELLLGPRRPRPHKAWRRRYVKLLIVGDSGIGKTTLVRTLLSTPGERLQVHDGSSTPAAQFARDPESLCTTVTWRDEEDRVVWVYRVQDTPGYSDLELPGPDGGRAAHAAMIRRYVHAQNAAWLAREQSPDRALTTGGSTNTGDPEEDGADDPRVDLVIYALPPHRLRASDLRYMAELGGVAPLLPVVCKCDTMTIGEARRFRREVRDRLVRGFGPAVPRAKGDKAGGAKKKAAPHHRRHGSGGGGGGAGGHGGGNSSGYAVNVFEFDRDTLARAGLSASGGGGLGGGASGGDDDDEQNDDAACNSGNDASGARDRRQPRPSTAAPPVPPFLVVASNDVNDEMGSLEAPVFWPERRYAWGTAEAFNPDHSDLLFLRALLLKEGLEAIVRDKRRRYEAWRREQLTRPRYGKALRSFLVWTAAPVAAVLWWARDPEGVRSAAGKAARVGKAAAGGVARGAKAVVAGRGKKEAAAPAAAPAAPPPPPAQRGGLFRGGGGGRAAALAAAAPPAVAVEPAAPPARSSKGPFGLW